MRRCVTLRDVPRFCRGRFRQALTTALAELDRASAAAGDEAGQRRAWTLFALCSRMLLHRPGHKGKAGKQVLTDRFNRFDEGDWVQLIAEARSSGVGGARSPGHDDSEQRRLEAACASVRMGEASRARQQLVGSALAPGTAATLAELRDPARRPPAPEVPLSDETQEFMPPEPVHLDRKLLLDNLRSAPRGSSVGLSGTRYEHLKSVLDDEEQPWPVMGTRPSGTPGRTCPSQSPMQALCLGAVTALLKPNGRVRGIVTGDAIRRLVARTLAQMIGEEIMDACAPFQYALSTRSGMDCVGHVLRAAADMDDTLTVTYIDGVGAFDHIRRQAMLSKLMWLPTACAMLPFVRLTYGQPSVYIWQDDDGQTHEVHQGEGGEQGDPLMPHLYALGQHPALEDVRGQLRPSEAIFAYLDDVYVLCQPDQATEVFNLLATALSAQAGVQVNLGKTKMWNKAGVQPPGAETIGPEVWVGGSNVAPAHRGIVVLGSPLGSQEFIGSHTDATLRDQQHPLELLPKLPDLQCAWVLLNLCASPRSNHALSTAPPHQSTSYAEGHDASMWQCLLGVLGRDADAAQSASPMLDRARCIAQLPLRLGGLGLRSAVRGAPAAWWASWADVLGLLHARHPQFAQIVQCGWNSSVAQRRSPTSCAACTTPWPP